ncbi:oxidoreductase [Desulfuromonas versatilis]|uniref:Oxidoreductase n=1 Tax=Desulfuromonas versatilis TaxID=2802975 RepID=A0ABM8HZM8_9BACT|nr:aldo/keto reductase [Desulfuromonas versatilis]BCR06070.1 oxidoreductase [Desulfuromonas versatilis]
MQIPKRILGRTGVEVTQLGLGGEGVLRTYGQEKQAQAVIDQALALGINYFESARAYSGSEGYYGLALGERRKDIFLTSKSHQRSAAGAREHLRTTLDNMKTDWLDLWQVHDVRSEADLQQIFAPGGAIEAFDEAKRAGRVRFVGVTGHEDPRIMRKALDLYDFDTVLMPVNPAEPAHRSFLDTVLPEARSRNLGIIGMKVLCRGLGLQVPGLAGVEPWIGYALSQAVSTIVIGCDDPGQVRQNVAAAAAASAMAEEEQRRLEQALAPWARRLMYYKP